MVVPQGEAVKHSPQKSGVTLRQATIFALDTLIAFSKNAHEESYFGDISFSEEKVRKFAQKSVSETYPSQISILAEVNGKPVGYLYAVAGDYYVGSDSLLTTVHVIHVAKSIRHSLLGGKVAFRLVRGIKQWPDQIGAEHLLFHITSDINPALSDRFMRKMGLKTLGGNYVGRCEGALHVNKDFLLDL
nr:hypothetical protein [uncultured Cohaesibacter sp.]